MKAWHDITALRWSACRAWRDTKIKLHPPPPTLNSPFRLSLQDSDDAEHNGRTSGDFRGHCAGRAHQTLIAFSADESVIVFPLHCEPSTRVVALTVTLECDLNCWVGLGISKKKQSDLAYDIE